MVLKPRLAVKQDVPCLKPSNCSPSRSDTRRPLLLSDLLTPTLSPSSITLVSLLKYKVHTSELLLTVLTVWNTLTQKEHSAFKVVLKIHFFLDHQIQDSRASLTLPALLFLLQFIFCIEHVTSKHSITLTYPFSLWSLFPV